MGRGHDHPVAGRKLAHPGADAVDNPRCGVAHPPRVNETLAEVASAHLGAAANETDLRAGHDLVVARFGNGHLLQNDVTYALVLRRPPHQVGHLCAPSTVLSGGLVMVTAGSPFSRHAANLAAVQWPVEAATFRSSYHSNSSPSA